MGDGEITGLIKNKVPVLVKVLAILDYISIVFLIFFGSAFLFTGVLINASQPVKNANTVIVDFLGIYFFVYGFLNFFIGRGLWKGKNWARIVTIIFYILAVLVNISLTIESYNSSILSRSQYVLYALISMAVAGYFLFNKKVKEAFA